jgi:hypothetical protein
MKRKKTKSILFQFINIWLLMNRNNNKKMNKLFLKPIQKLKDLFI